MKKLTSVSVSLCCLLNTLRYRAVALLLLLAVVPSIAQAQVRISAFYGNTGAAAAGYRRNFIELFNPGTSAVNLSTYNIQYASATGVSWTTKTLSGTIQPRSFFLVILATSDQNSAGLPLPVGDFTVSTTLSTAATAGKVALYSATTSNSLSCPSTTNLVDFIGYGSTADCRSPLTGGAAANNAPAPSVSTVLVRTNLFQSVNPSTNSNAADFIASTLATTHLPRNSTTTVFITDGSAEAAYGSALSTQNSQTAFGDAGTVTTQTANGSELDQAFGYICGGTLYLTLAGNLETNGNRINLFIDSVSGGQNQLRGDNSFIARMGLNGGGAGGPGMKFPSALAADYWLSFSANASNLFVDYGTLPTSAAGLKNFLGQNGAPAVGDGVLTGGDFTGVGMGISGGVRATLNNSNTAGVSGGTGAASGASVTTGVEVAIPLWMLGNPANPAAIRVFAFITSGDFVGSANQSLGGCTSCGNFNDSAYRDWSTTGAAAVTVPYGSPTITIQPPASVSRCANGTTTISLAATGATAFQWQQSADGITWAIANGTGTTTATMTTNSTDTAPNQYRCVVVNACGETISTAAALTVNANPVTPTGSATYTGSIGSPTNMTVTIGAGEVAEWFSGSTCTGSIVNTGTTYAFTPPTAGVFTFTARARNSTTNCTSAACLTVTLTVAPANDLCSGAATLNLNTPVIGTTGGAVNDYTITAANPPYTGVGHTTSTAPGKDVVYSFIAPSAGTYSFRVTNYASTSNCILYVVNGPSCPAAGAITTASVLSANNRNSGSTSEEAYCVSLTAAQQVYIIVDDNLSTNAGSTFTIEATRCVNEGAAANDTPATAVTYAIGESGMEYSITPASDADFFSLGAPAAGSRVFVMVDTIQSGNSDTQLRVTTATDTLEFDEDDGDLPFGSNQSSNSVISGTQTTGVATYIRTSNFSGTVGEPYRLYAVVQPPSSSATAESEPNDTLANATAAGNNYFTGSLSSTSDADLFSFTAYAGQIIFLGLDCYPNARGVSGTAMDGILTLLDSAGTSLVSVNGTSSTSVTFTSGAGSTSNSNPAFPGEGLVYRALATGTYYARVTSTVSTGLSAGYLLSVSTTPPPAYCTGGSATCAAGSSQLSISSVAVGSISNSSGDGSASSCYQDFSAQSTVMQRSLSYPITVTAINDIPGNAATVWVDFNANITLGDTGEVFALTQGPVGTYTGTITVPVGAGLGNTRMRIRVGNVANLPCGQTASGEVEDYTVSIQTAPVAPTNDTCAAAATVTPGTPIGGSTILATHDSAPSCDSAGASRDVWYTFTSAAAGIVGFNTCSTSGDTVLTLYSGACGSLSELACNDNCTGSPCSGTPACLSATIPAGTYKLRIGDKGAINGINFTLSSTFVTAPANSTCATAAAITVSTSTLTGSAAANNIADTVALDGTQPAFSCATPTRDVFYSFTAPSNPGGTNSWIIDTCTAGATTNTVLQVLSACGGTELACNDDTSGCGSGTQSRVTVSIAAGATVIIRVASKDSGGAFTVTINPALPGNDVCGTNVASYTIPSAGGTVGGSLIGANSEGNAASGCSTGAGQRDVFYYFTPASSCGWQFSFCGPALVVDTTVSILSACPTAATSNQIASLCDDDGCGTTASLSKLTVAAGTLLPGTPYIVRVMGYSSSITPGPFTLVVSPVAPVNETCSTATSLTVTSGSASIAGDNSCAAAAIEAAQGTPTCGASPSRDLWYTFTTGAAQAGNWLINTCSASTNDTIIAVYSGACGALTEVGCNDDAGVGASCTAPRSELTTLLAASTAYRVRVMSGAGSPAGGAFTLNLVYAAAPTNDGCAAAASITTPVAGTPSTATGTLQFATLDGPGASGCSPAVSVGVDSWFSLTTTAVGNYRFSTCGSTTDTVLELWSACPASSGVVLACNDDFGGACGTGSQFDISNLPVGSYRVRVANNFGTTPGGFTLTLSVAPPANDTCATAQLVVQNTITQGTNIAATTDSGFPVCTGLIIPASDTINTAPAAVWYTVVPTTSGTLTVDTIANPATGSGFDTDILAFSGACASLACIVASDDIGGTNSTRSKVAFPVAAGTAYYLLVGPDSTATGNFALNVVLDPRPGNDSCSTPVALTPNSGSTAGTTVGSTLFDGIGVTTSSGLFSTCTSSDGFFDVWYSYTPACTGSVTFDTCGAFDTILSIHSACPTNSSANLIASNCNNDGGTACTPGSKVTSFAATGGTTYLVRVAGATGSAPGGAFTLTWVNTNNPPTPPSSASSDVSSYCSGAAPANITLSATGGSGSTLQWFSGSCGGTSIGSGTPLTIAAPASTTTYFARWSNTCGDSTCASVTVTVNPAPVAPASASSSASTYCSGAAPTSIVLSASGGSGTTLQWFSGSCGGTAVGTGSSLTIAAPAASTTYFARWTNACGFSTCASVAVTVNASPVAPTGASSDTTSICSASAPVSITLSAPGGSGDSLQWFSGSCGGVPVGSGTPLTIPAPTITTSYFARWHTSLCGDSACQSITVNVNPSPVAPTSASASSASYCSDSVPALITLSATGGSGDELRWYSGSCGGVLVGTGSPLSITAPSATTHYFARWHSASCGDTPCASADVVVQPAPSANAGPDLTTCASHPVSLSGSAPNAASTLWSTSGSGTFDSAGSISTNYNPSPADVAAGSVVLTLTANPYSPPCTTAATDTLTLTITAAPTATYVDDGYTGLSFGTPVNFPYDALPGGTHVVGCDAFAAVQDGIDAVAAGGTVNVAAGAYIGGVSIPKTLSLLGPNAGVNPCTAARTAEAVLMPATGAATLAGSTVFITISGNNVVLDGLTVDGDNPALTSLFTANGANPDADTLISAEDAAGGDGLVVRNNIVKNAFQFAIALGSTAGPARLGLVEKNQIQNVPYFAGVLAYDDYYADIKDNCITDAWRGVQTNNFHLPRPGGGLTQISGNTITTKTQVITGDATYPDVGGILVNLHYQNGTDWLVTSNTVTNTTPGSAGSQGIFVWSIQTAVSVSITGNTIADFERGYTLWSCPTTSTVSINGGTVTGGSYGVVATNFDTFGDALSSVYSVSNLSISGAAADGILVIDDPANTNGATVGASLVGNTATGAAAGIDIDGASAFVQQNVLTGQSAAGVLVHNGAVADLGQCSPGLDLTGFGPSTGGNDLTGYIFDGATPFAIVNSNSSSQPPVYAANNLFGAGASDDINLVLSGNGGPNSAIYFDQSGAPLFDLQPLGATACYGSSYTFTAHAFNIAGYQWFHGAVLLTGETGPSLSLTLITAADAGDYTVVITDLCGNTTTSNPAMLTVTPLPVAPSSASSSPAAYCTGAAPATITLSAAGGSGDTLSWYSGSCGGTSIGAGNNLVIAAPAATTTYFARYSNSCGNSGCTSVTVTVNASPAAPTSAGSSSSSYCAAAAPVTITLSASGGSGDVLQWFSGSCGGTPVGTGSPLTIAAPSSSTTYYVRWHSVLCGNTACLAVPVTVDPSPVAPTNASASTTSFCSDSAPTGITLSASGGSGDTLQWFTGSCGGTPIGTGPSLLVAAPAATTTYFARWTNACGNSACAQVTVNRQAAPTANAGGPYSTSGTTPVALSGSASNSPSTTWSTSGTGTFDDASALATNYNPSAADVTLGTVSLTLTAAPTAPCSSAASSTVSLSISTPCTTPAVAYVDDGYAGLPDGTMVSFPYPGAPGGSLRIGCDAFATVQGGINGVADGGAVNVAAGTYVEAIDIPRTVSLIGPNAGIDPCTGARGAEAVLMPAAGTATLAGTTTFITISGSSVVIDGLTVDGDNPALTSPFTANGANPDTDTAISAEGATSGDSLTIRNNIVRNSFQFAIALGSTGGSPKLGLVEHNKVQNVAYFAGIVVYDNYYADIKNNCIIDAWRGVQTNNFNLARPGNALSVISGNTITTQTQVIAGDATYPDVGGILVNLHYQNGTDWLVTGNTLTNLTPNSAGSQGIFVWSIATATAVNLTSNTVTNFERGHTLWNCPTTSTVSINGGTVTGGSYGVVATNYDAFGDALSSVYSLSNLSISGAAADGILIVDDPANTNGATVGASLVGNTVTGSAVGVVIDGASGFAQGNVLTSNSTAAVAVLNGGVADLGQCSPGANITGFGASLGGNDFSGYGFDGVTPFAIVNQNSSSDSPVYAVNNTFGAGPGDDINLALSGNGGPNSAIYYSQTGPLLFNTQPAGATACAGTTVVFTASAYNITGYQWYKGGVPIPGQTGPSLTLTNVTSADAGDYTVVISGLCGSTATSTTASLIVTPLLVAPSSASGSPAAFCSGSAPATITLSASGGSGATLQWFTGSCGGTPVGSGNGLVIAAPTSTTTYYARYSNSCGTSGCSQTTVTVNASPAAPSSAASNTSSYCSGSAPATITISAAGGSGDSLQWFSGSCGGTSVGSGSPLTISAPSSTTTYFARWTTSLCGSSSCVSTTVTVNANPAAPTAAGASPTQLCDSGSVTLSASVGGGETVDWYTGSCGGTLVGSGATLSTTVSASTTFYARARNTATGCVSASCAPASVTVYPSPVAPSSASSSSTSYCSGTMTTIILSASGGSGDVLKWYSAGCGTGGGGTFVGNGSPLVIAAPASTTTYFARWETANCGASACASVAVNVQPGPSSSAGGPYTICANGVASLAGSVTNSTSSLWTSTGTGAFGNPAAPVTVYFPSASDIAAGSVFVTLAAQPTSPCLLPATDTVKITILPLPVAPTSASSSSNNYCTGTVATITLNASGGSGAKLAWFSGSCTGPQVGSGPSISIPAPTLTTTYFASWINACGTSACNSVTVTVKPNPAAPTSIGLSQAAYCSGSGPASITLTAVGGSGDTFQWFSGSCGGAPIGSGPSLTIPAPSSTTTYFGRWHNTCGDSACASATVTVNPLPVAPTSAAADNTNYCSGAVANISLTAAGGSGNTLKWYTGSCGGTLIGSGSPLVIAAPASGTTTYFARWETTSCGASACASVAVTARPLAVAPTSLASSANNYCSTSVATITLTATGGSGDTLQWFDDSCGGHLVGTGTPLTVPAPLSTTTYFARWVNDCGPSGCTSVTVTVTPATGACCSGWGTNKLCHVVAPSGCVPVASPSGAYRGNCTTCSPVSCCPADYNNSSAVGVQDIFDFLSDFLSPSPPPTADFNNNGTISTQDLFDFLAAFFAGC